MWCHNDVIVLQIQATAEEILPAFMHYAKSTLDHPLVYNQDTAALEPPYNELEILSHL